MSVKNLTLVLVIVVAALPALAGTEAPEQAKGPEVATFAVPGVKDQAVVKGLTAALAKEAGVLAAKADGEAGTFMITFEPAKTNPEALTKVVVEVVPDAKLEKVQPADPKAAEHDCGKCPSKSSCNKSK